MTLGSVAPILADSNGAAIAAVSVVSLVIGYGLLAGLWYFVFSPGAERRAERRSRAAQEALLPQDTSEVHRPPVAPLHRDDDPARLRRRSPTRRP
jgi:hypothetical protein